MTKAAAEEIFQQGSSEEIAQTLVDVAFSDLDRGWAQERCFDFLRADDWRLWGISAICLGHLLRRGFSIDLETAIPLIDVARRDERVRGQANDALGDIRQLHPALAHDRDVRARARLAQTLRQWLRREPALAPGSLWSALAGNASALTKLLDPIENRDATPDERVAIDVEVRTLLASIQLPPEKPITLFGDELDSLQARVDQLATIDADDRLELERLLAVLGCVIPAAVVVLDDVNRGEKITSAALAPVLAALGHSR